MTRNLRSLKALTAWIFFYVVIFLGAQRYKILPELNESGSYIEGVGARLLDSFYYQAMVVILVAFLSYGLCVLMYTSRLARRSDGGRPILMDRLVASASGLPKMGESPRESALGYLRVGHLYATAPLRDASVIFPAIGFIGTVVGVSIAISGLDEVINSGSTEQLLAGLRTAFDTTFLGLVSSVLLSILLFLIQAKLYLIEDHVS